MRLVVLLALLSTPLIAFPGASNVFKYQDESGNWVFTDKPPTDAEFELIEIESQEQYQIRPRLYTEKVEGKTAIFVQNPLFAPIELLVKSEDGTVSFQGVIDAQSAKRVSTLQGRERYRYKWALGSPAAKHTSPSYGFPVAQKGKYPISQGANGRFSHFQEPNVHAVDVVMAVGTEIVAARAGTVISVKDDYHMSGQNGYFLDKANYVSVLHDDGTYATYAHTLMGSARVQPGDAVDLGQVLAQSGSSGFSTGPHLHFVIRKNAGMRTVSVPFAVTTDAGQQVPLRRGIVVTNP
ncbi:M23 family metallopeptidase [Marinimicrobium agarilyticum]|uniref:M23 family metallopeptidase n=1 Tax=Marinimicrobium agarilyticum TaxID=306546 RepID=UPI000485ED97|nr:M23 family metallopeptidase [Marinimicrobium agarilyticum]